MGSLVKDTAASKTELRLPLPDARVAMSFPHLKVTFTLLSVVFQGQHSLGRDNVIGNVARFWLQKLTLTFYFLSHHTNFPHKGRHRAQMTLRTAVFNILTHLADTRVIMEFNAAHRPDYTAHL